MEIQCWTNMGILILAPASMGQLRANGHANVGPISKFKMYILAQHWPNISLLSGYLVVHGMVASHECLTNIIRQIIHGPHVEQGIFVIMGVAKSKE